MKYNQAISFDVIDVCEKKVTWVTVIQFQCSWVLCYNVSLFCFFCFVDSFLSFSSLRLVFCFIFNDNLTIMKWKMREKSLNNLHIVTYPIFASRSSIILSLHGAIICMSASRCRGSRVRIRALLIQQFFNKYYYKPSFQRTLTSGILYYLISNTPYRRTLTSVPYSNVLLIYLQGIP